MHDASRVLSRTLLFALAAGAPFSAHADPRVNVTVAVPDVPHVLSGEVDLQLTPVWAIGINGGGFAYTLKTSTNPIPLSIAALNGRIRFHPFSGAFFLGVAGGIQKAGASQSDTFTVTDPNSNQSVSIVGSGNFALNSYYVTPHLGWLWVGKSGFTWGFEAGAQCPFNSSSTLDLELADAQYNQYLTQIKSTAPYQKLQTDIQNTGNKIGNLTLPYLAIRFGWTF